MATPTGIPGFDTSIFPGLSEMTWLKASTNLQWCGYYLAPAPSHGNKSWMGQRAALVALGWGLAPLYVGQQTIKPGSMIVTPAQGTIDGADAAALMKKEGFPAGSFVYLDLENGKPFPTNQQAYVKAWVDEVEGLGFGAGVYCSHTFADDVKKLCPTARIWAFKVSTTSSHAISGLTFSTAHPSGSGIAGAFIWQHDQNGTLHLVGAPKSSLLVDLDTALTADPSV